MTTIPPSRGAVEIGCVVASLVACAVVAGPRLAADFWYDELWNLEHYQLASLGHVWTDFATPNNHVLHSTVGHLWLRLLGLSDLGGVLERPAWVRAPSLVFALLAALYVHATVRRCAGVRAGLVALVVALSSVPLLHYGVQLRGYSLAMLASAGALYHGWVGAEGARSRRALLCHGAALCGWLAALVMVSPANLYAALGVVAAVGCLGPGSVRSRCLRAGVALGGVLLGCAALAPIWPQLVNSPFVRVEAPLRWATLTEIGPAVLAQLWGARWGLLVAGIVGLGLLAVPGTDPRLRRLVAVGALACAVPLLLSFVRGDVPYERVFAPLLPGFVLAASGLVAAALVRLPGRAAGVGVAVVLVGSLVVDFVGQRHARAEVRRVALEAEERVQNLSHGYYNGPFVPREVARAAVVASGRAPVYLGEVDLPAVVAYVAWCGGRIGTAQALRERLAAGDSVVLITTAPQRTTVALRERLGALRVESVAAPASYHRVLRLTRPQAPAARPNRD